MTKAPGRSALLKRALHDVQGLTDRLVDALTEKAAARNLPHDVMNREEISAITQTSLEIVSGMLEHRDVTGWLDELAITAAEWGAAGVPSNAVVHGFHEGLRLILGMELVQDTTWGRDTLLNSLQIAITIMYRLCATVTNAHLGEHGEVARRQEAVRALTSTLLSGQWTATMALKFGISNSDPYSVLALSIRKSRHDPDRNEATFARRTRRRMFEALAQQCDGQELALLSLIGGTVLIPAELVAEDKLDSLVEEIAQAADVDLTATLVSATPAEIPSAANHAHEILALVERLAYPPGLYRVADLALEYQLSRPGPALALFGQLLMPLEGYPDLRETLRVHIANDMNRSQTAHMLNVHVNTVDYRLRRVAALTGLDPARASDLWQLRSAMIARDCR